MKKIMIIIICTVILIICSACENPIVYDRKPCHQENTEWVSEDGMISFTVTDKGYAIGSFNFENHQVSFFLTNDTGSGIYIHSIEVLSTHLETYENRYEYWSCDYKSKKKFVATVKETTYFDVDKDIVFYRVEDDSIIVN